MPSSDLDLVTRGYTVSVRTAAIARIGEQYVMRDRSGHRLTLPVNTQHDLLLEVWTAFRRAAAKSEPMPAIASGKTVSASAEEVQPAAAPDHGLRLVAADEHLDIARRHVVETEQRIVRQEALIQRLERSGRAEMAETARTLLDALHASLKAAHANVELLWRIRSRSYGWCTGPRGEPHARETPTELSPSEDAELAQTGA
jgi:hypothetical protein